MYSSPSAAPHLLLCCALVGLAGASPAAADDAEGGPRVAKLSIEGAEAVPESELFDSILTSKPDWRPWRAAPPFDPEDLEEDLARIEAIYREHGYYDAQAESSLTWKDDDRVAIVIRVHEGEPVRLASWRLDAPAAEDLPPDYAADLEKLLPATGTVFGVDVYRRVRASVLDRMGDLGHPAATLEGGAELDTDAHVATVEWTLRVGPTVRIGEIRITGLTDVDDAVVRRELTMEPGDRYATRQLKRSQRRVFDTALFRSVTVRPAESAERETDELVGVDNAEGETADADEEVVWPLEVRVAERPPRTFGVGVGYGTEDQFRARVDWEHRNFLGNARRVDVIGKYSSLQAGGEVTLNQPWFLYPWIESPLALELRLSAIRETPRAYAADRFREDIELKRGLGHGFTLRFGQGFEWADVTNQKVDPSLNVDLPDKVRLHTLPFGLRFEDLDDPIVPTRGTWLDFGVEPSLEAIGSEVDYVKLVAEARGFVPLGPTVFAARYRMGTLEPFAGSGNLDVPVFKRFYAGGSTSVRGFSYQKLGPRDAQGNPLGGLSWAEGSIELRVPIWKRLSGVVFSDAGQVNLQPSDWHTSGIYYSSGVGLRLATPIGPVRFDAARIYNPPSGIDRYGFYASVGHAF